MIPLCPVSPHLVRLDTYKLLNPSLIIFNLPTSAAKFAASALADLKHLGWLCQWKLVVAVDHRFAITMPALVSALVKKPFSKVSGPILAWSVLMSTGG